MNSYYDLCILECREAIIEKEDLKELWYDTHYYPMNPESDEWMKYEFEDALDILNPPEELLHSLATEEVVKLMMDYPYLWLLTAFNEVNDFFDFLENNCDIYNELISRNDGVSCLVKEYQKTDFDEFFWNTWGCDMV